MWSPNVNSSVEVCFRLLLLLIIIITFLQLADTLGKTTSSDLILGTIGNSTYHTQCRLGILLTTPYIWCLLWKGCRLWIQWTENGPQLRAVALAVREEKNEFIYEYDISTPKGRPLRNHNDSPASQTQRCSLDGLAGYQYHHLRLHLIMFNILRQRRGILFLFAY